MSRLDATPSFFSRLQLAFSCFWRALSDPTFSQRLALADSPAAVPTTVPVAVVAAPPRELAPEQAHASALALLGLLQREGRLIDFLQEDVSAFADADIGAAARVVHAGARKVLADYLTLEPVRQEAEGASVQVPVGFDAKRIRLTGNLAGQPPFRGTLKHAGWMVSAVRLPAVSDALDARILAPAEVEL